MTPIVLHIVCAWCGRVLQIGSLHAATSHGICPACTARFELGAA